jgi:antibiotic biosynthesis monooxygenase (ABM) superfamily enzyme
MVGSGWKKVRALPAQRGTSLMNIASQDTKTKFRSNGNSRLVKHRVRDGKVEDYLGCRSRAIAAQAHLPGYLATESFEPRAKDQEEWGDIVRYDSDAHLDAWMESAERKRLLKELGPIVESVHEHPVTGLEGGSRSTARLIPCWRPLGSRRSRYWLLFTRR